MKVSKQQAAEHRARIVTAAKRLFREHGPERVSVAQVTAEAGLTHGAFYGHFASKDALFVEACDAAFDGAVALVQRPGPDGRPDLRAYVDRYLSQEHVRRRADGCTVAALAGEAAREGPAVRRAFGRGIERLVAAVAGLLPGATERARRADAIAATASLVGAIVMARAVDDPALAQEILDAVRARISGARPSPPS
jgi:TetR/AcrR family transcriptional repressor of nem operon